MAKANVRVSFRQITAYRSLMKLRNCSPTPKMAQTLFGAFCFHVLTCSKPEISVCDLPVGHATVYAAPQNSLATFLPCHVRYTLGGNDMVNKKYENCSFSAKTFEENKKYKNIIPY